MRQGGNLENGKSWISDPKAEISNWTAGSSNFGSRLSVFKWGTRAFSKFPFLVRRSFKNHPAAAKRRALPAACATAEWRRSGRGDMAVTGGLGVVFEGIGHPDESGVVPGAAQPLDVDWHSV